MNLIDNIEIVRCSSARVVLGGTDANFLPINTKNCEGILFLMQAATDFAIEATTHFYMYLKASNTSSTQLASTGYARIGSTNTIMSTAPVAGSRDFRMFAIDYVKPTYEFVKLCVGNATGMLDPIAIKYGVRRAGSTALQDSTYIGGVARVVSSTL